MSWRSLFGAVAAAAVLMPGSAGAHRAWLLPSATILSGNNLYVTVDAAVSNDLFYFEHNPLRLDDLVITAPDGSRVSAENESKGKFRSTFDVNLKVSGTYRLAIATEGVFARYKLNGETKRWRGKLDKLADAIPAGAEGAQVTFFQRRIETFITSGKPTTAALKASGSGLEMEAVTHPNDLVAGSDAVFRFLLDGKPAAGVTVEVVRGGGRYRDKLGDTTVTADQDGNVTLKWPEAGMYWISASMTDDKPSMKGVNRRRATYAATLEVMPE
jgi:uncharacterized GH25 family protein